MPLLFTLPVLVAAWVFSPWAAAGFTSSGPPARGTRNEPSPASNRTASSQSLHSAFTIAHYHRGHEAGEAGPLPKNSKEKDRRRKMKRLVVALAAVGVLVIGSVGAAFAQTLAPPANPYGWGHMGWGYGSSDPASNPTI